MIWTYRVSRDQKGHYSVREVFYERDGTIIDYGKAPVALIGDTPEGLLQLVEWFKEAFDLPILPTETIDAQVVARSQSSHNEQHQRVSLREVMTSLAAETDAVTQ